MVLLLSDHKIKLTIIDYGFAYSELSSSCSGRHGTKGYRDPLVRTGHFGSMMAADWWSFGQVVYLIYTKKLLFNDDNEICSLYIS